MSRDPLHWPSDNPDVMKTALYFDTVNFASRIKAPVLAGLGFIDTLSPPAGVWTMLNQISGPVEPLPMIEAEHDNLTPDKVTPCPSRTQDVLGALLHGGQFTPKVMK
jgi:cephalosporin-C deacetylase-like acetyl esterase